MYCDTFIKLSNLAGIYVMWVFFFLSVNLMERAVQICEGLQFMVLVI